MKVADLPASIDLGGGHAIRFYSGYGCPDDVIGAIETHTRPDGSPCEGSILLATPETEAWLAAHPGEQGRAIWAVNSWGPLDLSPSLLCSDCGNHGFVRNGKWQGA